MNLNQYAIKLALSAALAYAFGNAMHSERISYVMYGAVLCLHPIAGDNIGYTWDKLRSAALGATIGMIVNIAFQDNTIAMLAVGPTAVMIGGFFLGVPPRVLSFSGVVCIMALTSTTYSAEPFNYVGIRFWNIFQGAIVGIAVNLLFWPDRSIDQVDKTFHQTIISLSTLYDQMVSDCRQGKLEENSSVREQLIIEVQQQLKATEQLMGNVKNEVNSPFVNAAPFDYWVALHNHLRAIAIMMSDLHLALATDEPSATRSGQILYQSLESELDCLVAATKSTFTGLSQVKTFRFSRSFENPLDNFSDLSARIGDRLETITIDNPEEIQPAAVKRFAAVVYGLRVIASDLNDLVGVVNTNGVKA